MVQEQGAGLGNLISPLRITAMCVLEHSGANTKAFFSFHDL